MSVDATAAATLDTDINTVAKGSKEALALIIALLKLIVLELRA